MAVSGNDGLHTEATLGIENLEKNVDRALKRFAELKKASESMSGNQSIGKVDNKPLTEYQAALLKIKQETLDFAKQKQDQAKADREASLATQAALKEETRIKREQIALLKEQEKEAARLAEIARKNAVDIDRKFNPSFQTPPKLTIAPDANTNLLRVITEEYKKGKITLKEYQEEVARLNSVIAARAASAKKESDAAKENTSTTKLSAAAKKELALQNAILKLSEQEAAAALKNSAREMNNGKGSLEQRRAALIRLTTVYDRLNKAERESGAGKRLEGIIRGLTGQIKGLEEATGRAQRSVGSYADGIRAFFSSIQENILTTLGPVALLTAAFAAAKEALSENIKISDNFTDVQRTAKLSKEEVREFGKELKNLDTRTNLEGLLDIGFIGGRLSVPKQDLEDFVKQVDELSVVLKKEFPGGAEAVAESLGRIVTIYKVTQNEGVSLGTALSKVGSNLLELAHSGPVTVKYLQDFTLGVAGTAASAKLSIPVISAYGAVLGESGQIASSAALSITRLVTGLTTKTGKYFAIAQLADSTLTIEKFTKIVNSDTKQALDLFFRGLKAGNPAATEFAARLGSVGITTGKVTNAVKILAENQDKLANRVGIGTKAFEEGTSVAHNFELANNNLAASVDKLHNAAINLTTDPNSSLAGFFKGIIDGSTYAIKALSDLNDAFDRTQAEKDMELLNRAKPTLYNNLFGAAIDPKELAAARERVKANVSKALNEEIAGRGFATADNLAAGKDEFQIRKLLTGEIEKQKIAADRLAHALAFVSDPKHTEAQSAVVERSINKLREAARQQAAVVAGLRKKLPKNAEIYGDGSLVNQDEGNGRTIEDIKAEIKALTDANKKLDIASKEFIANRTKLIALRKELKIANGSDTSSKGSTDQLLKEQRTLQAKIDDLHFNATKKQLSQEDQEVASIKQKYAAIDAEIEAFYRKVANRDKKYNGNTYKVNKSNLNADRTAELAAADAKNQIEKDKLTYDAQKVLFQEFETFKLQVGEKMARERFGKELEGYASYVDYLKKQMPAASDTSVLANQRRDHLNKIIPVAENEQVKATQRILSALLAENATYEQKRARLTKEYNETYVMITGEGADEVKAVLTSNYQEQLNILKDTAIQKTEVYRRLTDDTIELTKRQVKEQVRALDELIESGGLSMEATQRAQKLVGNLKLRLEVSTDQGNLDAMLQRKKDLEEVLNKQDANGISMLSPEETKRILNDLGLIQIAIDNLDPDSNGKVSWGDKVASQFDYLKGDVKGVTDGVAKDLGALSYGFNDLSQSLGGTDTQAGYLFDTFGKLAQAGSDAALAVGSFASGDIIGGITKTASAIGSILSISKKVKEMNAAARKEVADFYEAALKGETEYQAMIRKRDLEMAARGKNSYQTIIAQLEAIKKQSPELEKAYAKVFAALQGEEYVAGMDSKHGTWFRKAKTWDILASLAGSDYNRLEELYSQGKLKDAAKADFESLKSLKEELEALGLNVEDLQKQLGELVTGTSASGLANGLTELFKAGTRSAQDFGKSFEEIIRNSLLQGFKVKYLEDAMTPFYNELADMMKGSIPTDVQIAALKEKYLEASTAADEYLKNVEKITGQNLATPKPSGIQGAITSAGLTEDTANKAMGIWRGQYDQLKTLTKNSFDLFRTSADNLNVAKRIEANTLRSAVAGETALSKLDTIARNTSPSTSQGKSLEQQMRDSGLRL